jgi:putative PIN family toxin of toxin-antitoxin system
VRVVLDTNILIRANPKVSPKGLARDLLLTVASGPHVLVLSAPILIEVRRVLAYPHVQARWPLTSEAIEQYLTFLATVADMVESVPPSFPVVISDPDDDPILQTAITGHADVLCTRDEAFRHEVVEQVCRAHNIRIVSDVALIQELRRETRP